MGCHKAPEDLYALQLGRASEPRAQERDEEEADVLPPFAQRRQFDGHSVD